MAGGPRTVGYRVDGGYLIVAFEAHDGGPETLRVHDWAWSDAAGRQRVFALLGAFDGQVAAIEVQLPSATVEANAPVLP